jgi:hypothetical protein
MLRTLKHSFFALPAHFRRYCRQTLTVRAVPLAVALLLVVSMSSSQTVTPSPEKQQAARDNSGQETTADKRGTDNLPLSVKLLNTGKSTEEAAKEQQNIDRDFEQKRTADARIFWLTFALVIATVLQFAALLFQWWQLKRTVDATSALVRASKEEFIATHRPKLRVRNIDIHQPRIGDVEARELRPRVTSPLFTSGTHVSGQFYISNVGDTAAQITEIGCWVEWMREPLPMSRPYEGENGNVSIQERLEAGQTLPVPFMSARLMGEEGTDVYRGNSNWRIYVMGWVEYVDDRRTPRRTAYCREYRSTEGRFFAVEDPDYEHEE